MIELSQAAYGYDGGELLAELDLHIPPGSFHFLTGPSGSGKTTFLKLCYMELLPKRGSARILGRDVREMTRDDVAFTRRRIGVVHQNCEFLDHLPLAENLSLPLSVAGRDTAEAAADLEELLSWVGLEARRNALPPELSGGERQRAALARAVVTSPEVILADEPTGNIDWDMAQRLLRLLIELNRMGKAVVIATHDMNLIRAAKAHVPARVLRLRGGRLQLAGADL
ncbi:cell division protein FtsE [Maritimibacter sp. 55A14]|uniref:cell division ATP-binding protein FtsE n=1 Tax=Maritimibacter sp. 55A14 TaxID=2174844 RepID=UPI000D60CC31|nr:ATP-binding cassette domain-containing protein [Maritimibacter sp. 55A14]PWE32528.1 cell division protein FtsE [Maritimibacter sp. 55A14]